MGKISRIQLRGISRTPSDRLTEDGGCAESLNVSLDHSELAPSFIPEDVTKELGLPDDLQAEKVFVHKTLTVENYIVAAKSKVQFCKNGAPVDILDLDNNGEIVKNVTSFGNTIGVTTNMYTYWLLYKEGGYSLLGTNIPFPNFTLANYEVGGVSLSEAEEDENVVRSFGFSDYTLPGGLSAVRTFSYEALQRSYDKSAAVKDEQSLSLLTEIWEKFAQADAKNRESGIFSNQIHVILAVKLIDRSEIISTPIVLSAGYDQPIDVDYKFVYRDYFEAGGDGENSYSNHTQEYTSSIKCKIKSAYKIFLKLNEASSFYESWKDVIESINIYVSQRIATDLPRSSARMLNPQTVVTEDSNIDEETGNGYRDRIETTTATIELGNSKYSYEDAHIGASVFRLFKKYTLQEFDDLTKGTIVEVDKEAMSDDYIPELLDFSRASMLNSNITFADSATFNSRLIAHGIHETLELQMPCLNAVNYTNKELTGDFVAPRPIEYAKDGIEQYFNLTFYLKDNEGKEMKLTAKHPVHHPYESELDYIRYGDNMSISDIKTYANAFQFIICPDARAYKVDVKFDYYSAEFDTITSESIGHFNLKPHPYLVNCVYYYGGMGENLVDRCLDYDNEYTPGSTSLKEEFPNKVYISELNSPFVFPLQGRYTFQSRVLGVAIATTALSQGQFGQFPLYVFTEDGIWAMETAADGSFVTSKPLSRDVCVNPDSITSIDNAVVFVTDKGVMLLQGSQVVNISPNMNGRHYTIEETAKVILEKTIEDTIAKISKTPVDQMVQVIQNEVGQSISQQETRASIERTAQSIIAEEEFFKDLLPILSDSTHFMAFVREATIAYDYPGQRLVFIKKDEKYQYVYKLDTQTWHKTAYGIDLLAPINSYPECLVQGKVYKDSTLVYWYVTDNSSQEEFDYLAGRIRVKMPDLSDETIRGFLYDDRAIDVTDISEEDIEWLVNEMDFYNVATDFVDTDGSSYFTRIYDLSTILDAADSRIPTRGVIVTRPFDLGAPDVLKTITDIKIRGQYARGAVKFMLLGSMDGINFYVIGTKRGKAWKLFRLIILADLDPTERISWVDVIYEEKFTNRLR